MHIRIVVVNILIVWQDVMLNEVTIFHLLCMILVSIVLTNAEATRNSRSSKGRS